jgi:membrane-associated protein
MAVAPEEHASFWRRHIALLLGVGVACLVGVIVLIQSLDVNVSQLLADVPAEVAYLLCFLFVWFDAVIPIFPGETTLSAASTLAAEGELELGYVMLAGALGAIVGDSSLFWIARTSRERVQDKLDAALDNPKVAMVWESLQRSPGLLIVVGRFVPGMRFAVDASMGLSTYPYRRFLAWSILGGTLWSVYTCALAYKVATTLSGYPLASMIISGLITTAAIFADFFVARHRSKKRAAAQASSPEPNSPSGTTPSEV